MNNNLNSAWNAIAPALPPGIGGPIFKAGRKKAMRGILSTTCLAVLLGVGGTVAGAPMTAESAEAQNLIQRARHHFNTCSRDVVWKCHGDIQARVLRPGHFLNDLYSSRWLTEGSNGFDERAFWRLFHHQRYWTFNHGSNHSEAHKAESVLRELFGAQAGLVADWNLGQDASDRFRIRDYSELGDEPGYGTCGYAGCGRLSGYISPDEFSEFLAHRERVESRKAAERERVEAADLRNMSELTGFKSRCATYRGHYIASGAEGGFGDLCEAFLFNDVNGSSVYKVDEFVGVLPDNLERTAVRRLEDRVLPQSGVADRFGGEEEGRVAAVKLNQFKHSCVHNTGGGFARFSYLLNVDVCYIPTGRTGHGGFPVTRNYRYNPGDANLGLPESVELSPLSDRDDVALQITPVAPIEGPAAIAAPEDHRSATVLNRAEIIELQDETLQIEERLDDRIDANGERINDNFRTIATMNETLENRIEAVNNDLSSRIDSLGADVRENRQGIALGYALDTPGIARDSAFGVYGGFGHFEGETGLAVTAVGRLSPNWSINVGVGTTELTSGDDGVYGVKGGALFEW